MYAYLYAAKTKMLVSLAYRFNVFSSMISNFIIMFSTVYFWRIAYKGIDTVSGVDMDQMITYSIITSLLSTIYSFEVEQNIINKIREGEIAVDFIKPVNIYGLYFAQDIGNIISATILKFIPFSVFIMIFIKVPYPKSGLHFALFMVACIFSYLILWLLSAIVGLISFWVIDLGPLGFVKNVIVRILSGSVIPIWFFPQSIQNVLKYLPFIYTYQLPAGVYIGKISPVQAGESIVIQIIWALLLFLLFLIMQKRAAKYLLVQGG